MPGTVFDKDDFGCGMILRANVGCVDSGGGYRDGALSAYRWNGERTLARANFVTVGAPAG